MRTKTSGALLAIFSLSLVRCDCGGGLLDIQPNIDAEPNPLAFPRAYLGLTTQEALTVRNTGQAPLVVGGVRIKEGSHPGLFVEPNGFELQPGQSTILNVRLATDQLGPISGALLLDSNDPDTPTLEVPIQAEGQRRPGPAIGVCTEQPDAQPACVDPLRIDFGTVPFGQMREATITISSVGSEALDVTSALEAGAHPSITFEPRNLMETLAPDDARQIIVRFTPAVPEAVNAVLQIRSNDPERGFVPVIVTGNGVAPTLCLSEAVIDFGAVAIGDFAERTLTIESCGEVPIELTALNVVTNPEFSIQMPPTLPVMLTPGQTADVLLRYSPTNAGQDQDQLRIASNLPDSFVSLVGQAAACDLEPLPGTINFNAVGTGASRTRSLALQNAGAAQCELTELRMAAGTSAEFSIAMAPALPQSIAPGATVTVELAYAPTDAGTDSGTLEVLSSDPAQPLIPVPLTGRRLGPGECALDVRPDPINFGAVPIGTLRSIPVDIENVGADRCTISQVNLSQSSSRDFFLDAMAPMLIAAGQSRQVTVHFRPQSAATVNGELEIYTGLIPLNVDLVIPISGAGSGPQLCPMPTPVAFGTHQINIPVNRQLQLISCGTEALDISTIELPAPTSAEFSMPTPPALPLTIPPGAQVNLDLRFIGQDAGREDGILRLVSNDAVRPVQDIQLIADASDVPCGDVQGRLCDLSGAGPVEGGTVYIDTPQGRFQTTTDENGDWVITCVPAGTWTVQAEHGQWSTQFPATISPYTVETLPGQQCLDPGSANVAVVWGEWDQIGAVLDRIGVPYTFYAEGDAGLLVNNAAEMSQYDIVFFNCGWEEQLGLINPGRTNITNFVAGGGSVYASDWAYDLIEVAWPSYIDFDGDDTVRDAAQAAGPFNGPVNVVDPQLQTALRGRQQVTIDSCCSAVDTADPASTVYLQGDRKNDGGSHPFMVSFQPTMGSGRVFYTDFHNTGQADIEDIFRWLILQL